MPLDEIIVVDNASTDGTSEMVAAKFGSQITYLRLRENTGSSGGFCQGMRAALEHGHDWIWCMDNDAIPCRDTLEKLLEAEYYSDRSVVAKACSRTDPETGERSLSGAVVDFEKGRIISLKRADWVGKTIPVDCAPWAGLLVKSDVIRRAGFPPVGMFSWGDDFAFCFEIRKFGKILYVDAATLFHPGPGRTIPTLRKLGRDRIAVEHYWRLYYSSRNRLYLERVYFRRRWLWVFKSLTGYLRTLLVILLLDDFKLYRMQTMTRAFMDGMAGRLGRRVEPDEFRKEYGSKGN